jgi:hypothetical protein
LRVALAGEDCAHPFTGEIGRHVLAFLEHGRFGEIFPKRRLTVTWRRLNPHFG